MGGWRNPRAALTVYLNSSYLRFYNNERPHQALDYQTPAQVFEEGRSQIHRTEVIVNSKLVPV